jgi:hypothetical protein
MEGKMERKMEGKMGGKIEWCGRELNGMETTEWRGKMEGKK